MKKEIIQVSSGGKFEYEVIAEKEGFEKEVVLLLRAEDGSDYEIDIVSRHAVGKTKCRVEVRGVIGNGSRVRVSGKVVIDEGATGSDSFLAIKLLTLDEKSVAVAEPLLEIKNNEVRASHSVSVGRVDRDLLYYLESRGVEEAEAEKIIAEGFLRG